MPIKNFKQYVLDHTRPSALYTFEAPEQSVLDAGYKEQDFSENGFHLKTRDTEPYELTRFTNGNPVFGLDHYLQSTPASSINTALYAMNPGIISAFTAYAWFKPSSVNANAMIVFGQRKSSSLACWALYAKDDTHEVLELRVNGAVYTTTQNVGSNWHSVLVRKRFAPIDNKHYVDVFFNNVLVDSIPSDEYLDNPTSSFKLFSQQGSSKENGYKTPANDIALGCVAVWGRALSDDEINNLYLASTTGIEIGGGGNIQIPGNGNTTSVSGNIRENDIVVSRRVFAVTQKALPVSGSNLTSQAVLGSAISDPGTGDYTINTSPYEDAVLVVAEDDFGNEWMPDTTYQVNDVIRPKNFQGYVYHCTIAGTSSGTEPVWWFDTDNHQYVGTAQFQAKPFSRPLAHGPILPTIVPSA